MLIKKLMLGLVLAVGAIACGGVEDDAGVEAAEEAAYSVDCDWKPTANPTACEVRPGVWGITCESANKSCGNQGKACLSSGFTPTAR